jgi:hypothetical protein
VARTGCIPAAQHLTAQRCNGAHELGLGPEHTRNRFVGPNRAEAQAILSDALIHTADRRENE